MTLRPGGRRSGGCCRGRAILDLCRASGGRGGRRWRVAPVEEVNVVGALAFGAVVSADVGVQLDELGVGFAEGFAAALLAFVEE